MIPNSARSSCFYNWTYEVFLNFRGEDTRTGFTGFLYNSLRQKGIKTFFDDEAIERGEEIYPSLFEAIKESRMAITIFSPNYASSAYCLDELVHILECIKGQGRLVWPVFYDVEPSQVRHQKGSYEEALDKHEEKYGKEKVQNWRKALSKAANLAGLEIKPGSGYEYIYIERIIKDVSAKINRTPLHVTDYPVGLEPRVLEVNSLLKAGTDEGVNMVGICGIGGVGKTTIARAVYNLIGDKFEGLCFLSSVREKSNNYGLPYLQETLLTKIVGEKDIKFGDVNEGISVIKHRLNKKKVLLVLDDVDNEQQLKAMAGSCDWFGCGSRIIITTRDKHLLAICGVNRIYAVKELDDEEALKLFSWKAFGKEEVNSNYLEISKDVVRYSSGLPLALEVIGSNFLGKQIDEWISALDGYNKTLDTKIFEVLKLSYDTLQYTEKEIFLDVACFFNGSSLGYVNEMLQAVHDIKPEYAIRVLIEKSLIKIENYDCVKMHDLVQDMGKEIIRLESPKEAGGRSRLWFYKDILHVLQENTGTDKIEVLILELPKGKEEVQWSGKAFKKMKNLKILIIRNARFDNSPSHLPNSLRVLDWRHYPGNALPSDFHPTNCFSLKLTENSCASVGPFFTKNMENLTVMDFSHSKFLTQVSDLSGAINLQELRLDKCQSLIEIHDSVGFLSKLRWLSAKKCIKLRTLPLGIKLTSLEVLDFSGCSSLQSFPEILNKMENTVGIYLEETAIEELPCSIQNLTGLQELNLEQCKRLKQLPTSLCNLPELENLFTYGCSEFRHFSKYEDEERAVTSMESSKYVLDFGRCNLSDESLSICLSRLPKVTSLNLSYNSITILPACIKECYHLRELHVGNCEQLRLIEEMPPNLEIFFAENCISLTSLSVSKVFCELDSQTRMIFSPGNEVPKWFHHYNDGNLIEFWVRKEFPALDLCVVIAGWEDGYMEFFEDYLCLRVNDKWTPIPLHVRYDIYDLQMDHMLLFRLGRKVVEDELQGLLLPDQWNRVEVSVEEGTAKSIGIYVYEQENTMHNILFSRPSSLKRTCRDLYNSNSDLVLGCHPLIKKLFPFRGVKNNDTDEWPSLRPPWQEPPLPNVNDGDSNSMALASTGDTINDQDGASMQTSSKKQPSSIAVPIAEENHEEVGLSDNQETFSPPNLETKEVTVNTSMDFEAINKMIQEDPMSAIERLLNGKVSVSSTISGQPEIQIPYFESLQKELKSLLTKFDFSSLISDDFHRSNICFYIEGLEKFESLQPAHRAFIQNFRNFFLNAASNYNKLNEVTNKRIQLKVEREVVSKKLQEARAKDEQMTALISSASLRVKEIVSSNEEIEAQLLKLKHEKEVFELAIIECGKQKEKLRTDCLSWAHQSRDLVVELTKTKKIAQFLEGQVETDKTNFQKLVASIPF